MASGSKRAATSGNASSIRRASTVLRRLQVRIDSVIHRVQFFGDCAVSLRDRARRDVGVDRFLPVAEPRKRVRRHVQRVRRRRRDFRVTPGGFERPIGERRKVVAVDDVVREARMIRLAGDEPFENRAGLAAGRRTSCRSVMRRRRSITRRRSTLRCRSGRPRRPSTSHRDTPAHGRPDRVVSKSAYSRDTASTYARSRSVFVPIALARSTASRPCCSGPAGRMPTAKGLLHRLSAMPHSAIAQDGSVLSVAPKASMARRNSNEWRSATARLNCGCAAALQEVAKATVPSFSAPRGVLVVLCVRAQGKHQHHDSRRGGNDAQRHAPQFTRVASSANPGQSSPVGIKVWSIKRTRDHS